jgi:hypothetical protein
MLVASGFIYVLARCFWLMLAIALTPFLFCNLVLCFALGSLGCAHGEFIFAAHLGFVEPKWFEEQQPLMLSFYYKIHVRTI